jgi:hypothetical protein
MIPIIDRSRKLPIFKSILTRFASSRVLMTTDSDINNDILVFKAHLSAPVNSCIDVCVPNSATINQHIAIHDLRREGHRQGTRGHTSLGKLIKLNILICEGNIGASIGVQCRNDELSLEFSKWLQDGLKVLQSWSVVSNARQIEERVDQAFRSHNPDLICGHLGPLIGKPLRHGVLVACGPHCCAPSVESTGRHPGNHIPSVIFRIPIMEQTPDYTGLPCTIIGTPTEDKCSTLVTFWVFYGCHGLGSHQGQSKTECFV